MNDYVNTPDIPLQVALIVLVSMWGILSCVAALTFATLG